MRNRGFTLIEVLVVVMVIGLAMAVVAGTMGTGMAGQQMRSASRDMVAALRHTRGQAIVKREAQVLSIDVEGRSYTAAGRATATLPKGLDLDVETARSEVSADGIASIRFFPDGSSTGGSIELSRGTAVWRIEVNWLTGEVVLREPGRG